MNKTVSLSALCLAFFLFSGSLAFAQSTQKTLPAAQETATAPVKKDKNQKENPNATLNGGAPVQSEAAATPIPVKKSNRIDPADIRPMDPKAFETQKQGEVAPEPKATAAPFGNVKPVAGQKTVEPAPLKRPENLQPASPKAGGNN